MNRPTWIDVFREVAQVSAWRSTCPRLSVGAVVFNEYNRMLTGGYNGAPYGMKHCTDIGCWMVDGHCVRAVHAEANAILQAARFGPPIAGASILTTHRPCIRCAEMIVQAGLSKLYFSSPYTSEESYQQVFGLLELAGVKFECIA